MPCFDMVNEYMCESMNHVSDITNINDEGANDAGVKGIYDDIFDSLNKRKASVANKELVGEQQLVPAPRQQLAMPSKQIAGHRRPRDIEARCKRSKIDVNGQN